MARGDRSSEDFDYTKPIQDDYSELGDHSTPIDTSNYSKTKKSEQPNKTASDLNNAEKEAANLVPGYKEAQKQQKDIAGLENSKASGLYGGKTSPHHASKSDKTVKGGFMGKAKNKIVFGIITAIIAVLGWLVGPAILGTTGILHFQEMLYKHFNINIESITSRRMNKMIFNKINENKRTPRVKGLCTSIAKVACRYSGMSKRALNNLERRTGIKVNAREGGFKIPGRLTPESFTLPDGRTLNAGQFSDLLKKGDPVLHRHMREAMKPRVAAWATKKVQKLFGKLKLDKAGGFIKENTTEKAKEKIKERQKGSKAKLSTKEQALTGGDGLDKTSKQQNAAAEQMLNDITGNNKDFLTRMAPNLSDGAAKTVRSAARGVGRVVAITGAIDLACTALNIIAAIGYIAKAIGAEQLMAFVTTFLSSVDGMKAMEGTTAGWQAAGELLFTVDESTGQTAFQSFGYGMISGEFWGDDTDTMEFKNGGGLAGGMIGIRDMVLAFLPGDGNAAVREVCGVIQNIFFRLGSAAVGIVAAILSSGSVPAGQIVIQGGIMLVLGAAISFLLPVVARMIAGELVGPETIGGSAGNAMTSGMGALAGQNGNAQGLSTMTKSQATAFDINVRQPYLAAIQEDERLAANPWDFYNPYSVVGSIAGGLLPYFSNGSWMSNLSSLASLAANPFNVFSPKVSAASREDYYRICQDQDYIDLEIAADPFCNPVYGMDLGLLEMDPDEVIEKMLDGDGNGGYINDEGVPQGSYKDFIDSCTENTAPIGFWNEEVEGDVREPKCVRGSDEFNRAGYDDLFYIYTVDDSVYQMMDCVLDENPDSCYAGDAGQSGGGTGDFDYSSPDEILAAFIAATGGTGDYDGAAGQQCVDVSAWFVGDCTTLSVPSGNGNDFVANLVTGSSGKVTLDDYPRAPGIFSAKSCDGNWAIMYNGACYGHTGLVISVKDNGGGNYTVTTMEGWNGANPIAQKFERPYDRNGSTKIDFVYLGDVLKK